MKNLTFLCLSVLCVAFTSCDTSAIQAKTQKYCDCLKSNDGNADKCVEINDEILKVHPADTKEYSVIMEEAKKCASK